MKFHTSALALAAALAGSQAFAWEATEGSPTTARPSTCSP